MICDLTQIEMSTIKIIIINTIKNDWVFFNSIKKSIIFFHCAMCFLVLACSFSVTPTKEDYYKSHERIKGSIYSREQAIASLNNKIKGYKVYGSYDSRQKD